MDLSAVILAGGESRRMGRDKAWVELGGRSLLVLAVDLPRMTTAFLQQLDARCDRLTGAVPRLLVALVAGGGLGLLAGLTGIGGQALVWQPVFAAAVAIGAGGALLGTHLGVHRWRTAAFRRSLAVALWIAAAKLILTGK